MYGKYTILSCSNFDSFKHNNKNISMENIFLFLSFFVSCITRIEMEVGTAAHFVKRKKEGNRNILLTIISRKYFAYLQHQYQSEEKTLLH